MTYSINKNWLASFELILRRPVILLPFAVIAFLEALALEVIYFFPRKPVLYAARPIVMKFFGEPYLHYPENMLVLPRMLYYAQAVIYIFMWGLLAAMAVNIVKNIRAGAPIVPGAVIRSAFARYPSLFLYGVLIIISLVLMQRVDMFLFSKYAGLAGKYLPRIIMKFAGAQSVLFLFLSNIIMQVFVFLTVPIIVIERKSLLKALGGSIYTGVRRFLTLFKLIFAPFLLYFPFMLLKSVLPKVINKTFPEVAVVILAAEIVATVFVDTFVIVCAVHFLSESDNRKGGENI